MKLVQFLLGVALLASAQFFIIAASSAESAEQSAPVGLYNGVPEGYAIALGTFSGTIEGEDYEINGTATSVFAELQLKHPNHDWEAHGTTAYEARENSTTSELSGRAAGVVAKHGGKLLPPDCMPVGTWGWQEASVEETWVCIKRMRQVGGRYKIGPRTCNRLCCHRQASIFFCNDRYDTIDPDVKYLSSYVSDICDICGAGWDGLGPRECGGQLFDSDDYNIILRRDMTRC